MNILLGTLLPALVIFVNFSDGTDDLSHGGQRSSKDWERNRLWNQSGGYGIPPLKRTSREPIEYNFFGTGNVESSSSTTPHGGSHMPIFAQTLGPSQQTQDFAGSSIHTTSYPKNGRRGSQIPLFAQTPGQSQQTQDFTGTSSHLASVAGHSVLGSTQPSSGSKYKKSKAPMPGSLAYLQSSHLYEPSPESLLKRQRHRHDHINPNIDAERLQIHRAGLSRTDGKASGSGDKVLSSTIQNAATTHPGYFNASTGLSLSTGHMPGGFKRQKSPKTSTELVEHDFFAIGNNTASSSTTSHAATPHQGHSDASTGLSLSTGQTGLKAEKPTRQHDRSFGYLRHKVFVWDDRNRMPIYMELARGNTKPTERDLKSSTIDEYLALEKGVGYFIVTWLVSAHGGKLLMAVRNEPDFNYHPDSEIPMGMEHAGTHQMFGKVVDTYYDKEKNIYHSRFKKYNIIPNPIELLKYQIDVKVKEYGDIKVIYYKLKNEGPVIGLK
ncbi:uncharacterized protein LOC117178234 [Belonocnema kinseyi]|uniref:uncharacterized protein LOC117178234 n=1 Tax=Belonocnema kinseyi TaxID=2817044 RepID=UPI00143D4B42|nr:uncharacterized protein LOC117178234 [Belonocnema kinseyi]